MSYLWEDALCNGKGDLFFSTDFKEISRAERICQDCPRLTQCAELGKKEVFGVWGGKNRNINILSQKRFAKWKQQQLERYIRDAKELGVDVELLRRIVG